jgi:hypothetical protein
MSALVDTTPQNLIPSECGRQHSWLLCRHLSDAEKVYRYYQNSGLIAIQLGKCLCEDCFDSLESLGAVCDWLDDSRSVSDEELQYELVDPLILANRVGFQQAGFAPAKSIGRQWRCCAHLTGRDSLQEIYSIYEAIFIRRGFLTCSRCKGLALNGYSGPQARPAITTLTDKHFQDRIVGRLLPVNQRMLTVAGRIGPSGSRSWRNNANPLN